MSTNHHSQMIQGRDLSLAPPVRLIAVAVAVAVAAALAALAPLAYAGTSGQQIALDFHYSDCANYGQPAGVRITGQNHSGQTVTWQGGYSYTFADRTYVRGWWWQGVVKVTWRSSRTGRYYQTNAFIPQGNEADFQMWPDIVTVDCHGSLRKVSSQVEVNGTPGAILACGGWRDGAGLKETIFYTGYDEYQAENVFTYAINGSGWAPRIVTWQARVPIC